MAVIFDQPIDIGGGYQQSLNAALLTRNLPSNIVNTVYFTTLSENLQPLKSYGFDAKLISLSFFERARAFIRRQITHNRLRNILIRFDTYHPFEKKLIDEEIDLVYFLSPNPWASSLESLNYITTVWDLCHRDTPEFPEVRRNRQLESRDDNYLAILPRAVAIFVDSGLGKVNVTSRYCVDKDRVFVMPFQAAESVRRLAESGSCLNQEVAKKYKLDIPYVFYPAQFWAHKNHVYLLEGLCRLEQLHGLRIAAIFSGSDRGNKSYIQSSARKLGLESRVRFVGVVSNEEVVNLYRQSIALVMPTYFGPTNLPPIEAFELGVPVLYPDRPGLRDQVDKAALLMDLNDPSSMADQLRRLISEEKLRDDLIKNGHKIVKELNSVDRAAILRAVIEDFRWKRLCWE